MRAVDEIIRIHDGADVRLFDGGLERRQINLMQRALLNDRIGVVPEEFRIVRKKMFDRCADAFLLHADDVADADC